MHCYFDPRSRNRYRVFINGKAGPIVKKAGVERLRGAIMGGRKPPPPLPEFKPAPTFVKVHSDAETAVCPDPKCGKRNYFQWFSSSFTCTGECGKRYEIKRNYN